MSDIRSPADGKRASSHRGLWILLATILVLLSAVLRLIDLDADPVPWLDDGGYQIDEGYKTLSPRNLINFGDTHWNEKDRYQGWMDKSPMTQWPYYAAFKQLGLEISSARLVNLIYTITLIALLGGFMYRRLPACHATLGVVLLTADMGLFLFSRSALFETSITLVTFVAFMITARISDERPYLALITLIIAGVATTFLVKQSAIIYVAPGILAVLALALSRNITLGRQHLFYGLLIVTGIVVMAWLTQGVWKHKLDLERLLTTPQALFLNPIHTLSPFALAIGYVALLDFCLRNPAALFLNRYRLILASLVIAVPIAFTLFKYFPQRYFLPVIPAALLLAVEWLAASRQAPASGQVHPFITRSTAAIAFLALTMTLMALAEFYGLRNLPIKLGADAGLDPSTLLKLYPLALLGFALLAWFAIRPYWSCLARPSIYALACLHVVAGVIAVAATLIDTNYEARSLGERIRSEIGADKSVGGDWAPFFFKELPQKVLYMRSDYNNAKHITKIRPDYFLFSDTYYDNENLKGLMQNPDIRLGEPLDLSHYRSSHLRLYPIEYLTPPQN